MSTNFVSYADSEQLFGEVGNQISALQGAYIIRGDITFANLPSVITPSMNGYTYNVTDDFTTDSRFIEVGRECDAGTNVTVVDRSSYSEVTPVGSENPSEEGWYELKNSKYVLTTDTTIDSEKTYYEKTEIVKFDVTGQFINIKPITDKIQATQNIIAEPFDATKAYAKGNAVIYEDALYEFDTEHTAGPWDSSQVHETSVKELIDNAEPESLTTTQINNLLAIIRGE